MHWFLLDRCLTSRRVYARIMIHLPSMYPLITPLLTSSLPSISTFSHHNHFLSQSLSPTRSNTMLRTIPAHLEITLRTTISPAILMATQMTLHIPVHASVVALKVVHMRARTITLPSTTAIAVAVVIRMVVDWCWIYPSLWMNQGGARGSCWGRYRRRYSIDSRERICDCGRICDWCRDGYRLSSSRLSGVDNVALIPCRTFAIFHLATHR